jgi:undecaprenyl-diphosphatase
VITNPRRVLVVAAALLAGAVLIGVLIALPTHHDVQTVDDATRRLAVRAQNGPTTALAKGLSFLGSTWINWTLRGLASVVLLLRRKVAEFIAFALAVVTSEVCIGTLKAAFDRSRPPGSLISTSGASFPSGHAIAAAVTALGLVIALVPPGSGRRRWVVLATGFAVLMALSRIYLRAHWLSDAVAGSLLGAGLAVGWPAVISMLRDRRQAAAAQSDQEDTWENA